VTRVQRPVQTGWDDNCPHCRSPFRKVIWKPLVKCTACGEMYRLPERRSLHPESEEV
jgi:uncharacterized protein (DUF983 family)